MAEPIMTLSNIIMMKKEIIDQVKEDIINEHGRTNLEETFLKIVGSKDEVA